MDPSAYMDAEGWNRILKDSNLNAFDLRDNRYNQVKNIRIKFYFLNFY